MSERKNFNYKDASAEEIAEQFKKSSRQTICNIRTNWKNDVDMSAKIESAYRMYKRMKLEAELDY